MGRMKWEMIFWIAVTLFFIVNGQDVSFEYDGCYSSGITMTAKYTGSGTVNGVQWYYSGKTGSNLLVTASTCTVFGSIPPGYPNASQMHFQCPPALDPNTFKLTVTGLEGEDLENSWGATFSLSSGSAPAVEESSFSVCGSTSIPTTSAANTTGSTTSPPNVTDKDDKKIIIGVSVGVVIAVVLAILIGVCCYLKYRNKERKQEHSENNMSYSNNQGQDVQHGRFSNKSYETENKL